jgi:TPR repeat protein
MKRSRIASQGVLIILLSFTANRALATPPQATKGHDARTFDMHYGGCNEWKDGRACTNLGYMYAEGRSVEPDAAKAAEYFEKACKYNDPAGCTALGVALVGGVGVAKDLARAAQLFERACERADLRGCTSLGFLYATGQGVAKDAAKAVELFQKSCDGGNAGGCNNIHGYHAAACQAGDGHHCLEGGRWGQATLKKKDLPEGLRFDGSGVAQLLAEAARLLPAACDGGKAQECADLASMYSRGEGVPQDKPKAAELYRKACELGLTTACAKP